MVNKNKAPLGVPIAADGTWLRCQDCAHSNRECDFCELKKIRINRALYGCPNFKTPVQLVEQIKKAKLLEAAKKERMLNYLLTAMCNCATATQMFLVDFCSFFEDTKKESKWRFERAKAANEILSKSERIQTLHAQFFQSDMNKVHTDHGQKEFDDEAYDNHQQDAYELCRLIMLYIDRCWGNEEAANKVVECLENLETGHIFSDKDIERFRLKH